MIQEPDGVVSPIFVSYLLEGGSTYEIQVPIT